MTERGALCIRRKALTTSEILSSRSSMLGTEDKDQIYLGCYLILYVYVQAQHGTQVQMCFIILWISWLNQLL